MKKAQLALVAITLSFICIAVGIFVGRSLTDRMVFRSEPAVQGQGGSVSSQTGKIDLNSATVSQLTMLPDIGPVLAQRIIDFRTENGPFKYIEDLLLVEGIGEKRLENLRDYITVGG